MGRYWRRGRWLRLVLLAGLLALAGLGCRSRSMPSPSVIGAEVHPAPTPLPQVPGLTDAQVASLASLTRVDDYPLYVMHLYERLPAVSHALAPHLVSLTGDAWSGYDSAAFFDRQAFPTGSLAPVLTVVPGREQVRARASSAADRPSFACSLFAALGDDGTRLYGRNFDWDYSPVLLLKAHRVSGYDSISLVDLGFFLPRDLTDRLAEIPLTERAEVLAMVDKPFDGMNDRGLVVGMAAVPDSPMPSDDQRPTIGSLGIMREVLDHAATVDEALARMRSYNIDMGGGPQIHYLLADPSGDAVLVEFRDAEMIEVRSEEAWHVATNHYRASLETDDPGGCRRYERLQDDLKDVGGTLSAGEAMDLLAQVAQSSTQWSAIYDMDALTLTVALARDYENLYRFEFSIP